jgi:outer membrane PBP1 activator LpoA protein
MPACLRSLPILCLLALLAACTPSRTSTLGELPRTPQASIEAQLEQANRSDAAQAALLRLSAADQARQKNDLAQALRILELVPIESLRPAQQIFASTLSAEIALAQNNPKIALQALQHPSLEQLGELPVQQQLRTHLVRADSLAANGQPLAAIRERLFISPLLSGAAAADNQQSIWKLANSLPAAQLKPSGDAELDGWLALAHITRNGNTSQRKAAIEQWQATYPQHPAGSQLPELLANLSQVVEQQITRIALLLPESGPLENVAHALRDGFLAAQYQAQQNGENPPAIQLYDSNRLASLDAFYSQAQKDGIQMVVGPLEKPMVKQLAERQSLPLPTLALNYSDAGQAGPEQLFQFGLSPEDEAREVARRAWADGHRRAVALVPQGEWGQRVTEAFRQSWQSRGGTLIAVEHIDQPVRLAQQIADLFQLRQSEARAKRVQSALGVAVAAQPARRQDVDFIFLAATPQQAQQIKPTLAFQYAGDVPVYATSNLYSGVANNTQFLDLDGIRFCETPWLLDPQNPLRQSVVSQWNQADGSLGRLYAMGADAYTLISHLTQLQAFPENNLDGLSGSLSLNASRRIERQLPWAEFRNGEVVRLPDAF